MLFLTLALLAAVAAYFVDRHQTKERLGEQHTAALEAKEQAPIAEEPIATALKIDLLRLELGYGLLSLINTPKGQHLTDQLKALRRSLATEVGFIMPLVRIQDNMQLAANTYVLYVKDVAAGRGDLRPNMLLVMDPRGEDITPPGEKTREPTFGLPALWIDPANRGGFIPWLYGGRSRHGCHYLSDRGRARQHGRTVVVCRNPEVAG